MVRVLALGAAVLLVGAAAADDKKGGKLDPAKLAGTYAFVSGTKDGEKVDAGNYKGMTLAIAKDTMLLKSPDGDFKFGYKIDATKTPAALDLEILEGPVGKGAKSKGIIAQDGDVVKIAYHPMEGDRPKDFDAKKGSGVYAFTVKKAAVKK